MDIARLSWPFRSALVTLGLLLFHSAVMAAANQAQPTVIPQTPDPLAIQFLLDSAAKDFRTSQGHRPIAIRDAKVGLLHEEKSSTYVLCGFFKAGDNATSKWTPFATIKTVDYEHWLGGSALQYCRSMDVKWYKGDHSGQLMLKLRK